MDRPDLIEIFVQPLVGGGEKHVRDIAGILRQQGNRLDMAMLGEAAIRLRLEPEWRTVLSLTSHF